MIALITAVVIAALLTGCEIERSPTSGGGPEGSIHLTAVDTSGVSITGGRIRLDNVERIERTPAFIHGVPAGLCEVEVAHFGYYSRSDTVTVSGGDTSVVRMILTAVPADLQGFLAFTTDPQGARLLIEGSTFLHESTSITAPAVVPLAWGIYRLSAHLTGYSTAQPLLPEVQVSAGDTVAVAFRLEPTEAGLQAGALPFDFTLENDVGDSVRLSDLTGYVVLLNFWFAECDPCKAEFPGIEAVYRAHREDGFQVLGIDPMLRDTRERVSAFRDEFDLTFQLLLDFGNQVTYNTYRVVSFPTNVLIDRRGVIHAVQRAITEEELEGLVTGLLAMH